MQCPLPSIGHQKSIWNLSAATTVTKVVQSFNTEHAAPKQNIDKKKDVDFLQSYFSVGEVWKSRGRHPQREPANSPGGGKGGGVTQTLTNTRYAR